MNEEYFITEAHCEFIINLKDVNAETATKELGIKPDRFFDKGDIVTSKHSPRNGTRSYGLWAITSKNAIDNKESLSVHFSFLQSILQPKVDVLLRLIEKYDLEYSFWIWMETNDAGFSFDLSLNEVAFINHLKSKISFSLIVKNEEFES